jgi:hypothetical protein
MRGCLAPQRHPAFDHVRLRAVENVWNSYVLQLCVINSFFRDGYDARCPRRPDATSVTLTIFCGTALQRELRYRIYFL